MTSNERSELYDLLFGRVAGLGDTAADDMFERTMHLGPSYPGSELVPADGTVDGAEFGDRSDGSGDGGFGDRTDSLLHASPDPATPEFSAEPWHPADWVPPRPAVDDPPEHQDGDGYPGIDDGSGW